MVLPLLSMMLVSIIFGGIMFYNYVELANAVAVGARQLAANGANEGTNACSTANTALLNSAGNLNTSLITIAPETFASGNKCTTAPVSGDAATVTATYPCNLPIPFTGINLCPVQGTNPGTGTTNPNCPTLYCMSATTTVSIE
jgi:Flp pilus assembly protein TadG